MSPGPQCATVQSHTTQPEVSRHVREGRCLNSLQCPLGREADARLPVGLVSLVSDTSRHRHMHHTWGKGLGMRMGDSYAHTWTEGFCSSVSPETGSESRHSRPRHARTRGRGCPAQALERPLQCHHKHSRGARRGRGSHAGGLVKLLHPMSGGEPGCAPSFPPPPTAPSSPSAYSILSQSAPSKACITGPTSPHLPLGGRLLRPLVKTWPLSAGKDKDTWHPGASATAHVPVSLPPGGAPDSPFCGLSPQSSPTHTTVTHSLPPSLPSGAALHQRLTHKTIQNCFQSRASLSFM